MDAHEEPIWLLPQLSQEIINNKSIFNKIDLIVTDITQDNLALSKLTENMAAVLTDPLIENRVKGMSFLTEILKRIPKHYLSEIELKFFSKFYSDRLKDNHSVIPIVLEGYLSLIEKQNYYVQFSSDFITILFREVPCQSQGQKDRFHIYLILKRLFEKDFAYFKTMGPDLVYNVITAIDGERDPKNLYFIFNFLRSFLSEFPLGHLADSMFEVISCYYPIDFHPAVDDPTAISRKELAEELAYCLAAVPEFAQNCLTLLIEKLDSDLRVAKMDSLMLLIVSCKKFSVESYSPFLKTLWSSIYREVTNKTDEDLKMLALKALRELTSKISTEPEKENNLENFLNGILITVQTAITEASTVAQFIQNTRIILTVAYASDAACTIILRKMVPAAITYYEFHTLPQMQVACLKFLGELADAAKHWDLQLKLHSVMVLIPKLCQTAVSESNREYQIAGFQTLTKNLINLDKEHIQPFIEILIFNIENSEDKELIETSVNTMYLFGKKYPDFMMGIIFKGKRGDNYYIANKQCFIRQMNLLCKMMSIGNIADDIIPILLSIMSASIHDESLYRDALEVVKNFNEVFSDETMFSENEIARLDDSYSILNEVLMWATAAVNDTTSIIELKHGFDLISKLTYVMSLENQIKLINCYTDVLINRSSLNSANFMVSSALYKPLRREMYVNGHTKLNDMYAHSLEICYLGESDIIKREACILLSHFVNKALPIDLKEWDSITHNYKLSPNFNEKDTLVLFAYLILGLMYNNMHRPYFHTKFDYLTKSLADPNNCNYATEAFKILAADSKEYLTEKFRCEKAIFYKQRLFEDFLAYTSEIEFGSNCIESYLLALLYILKANSKTILLHSADRVINSVIDSLSYNNKDLLTIATDLLAVLIVTKHSTIVASLQTILPRLVNLSSYVDSMDVRIKSLECLYEIASNYPTILLLPFKQDLLYNLSPSLDDKKRLVRNMAVKARTRWFLVGAPGE